MRREEIKHIIEAVMFAYGDPISIKELNHIINEELASKEIEYMLNSLIEEYNTNNRGIQIIKLEDIVTILLDGPNSRVAMAEDRISVSFSPYQCAS